MTRSRWFWGVLPLILLAILVVVLIRFGPLGVFQAAFPPVEELTVDRVVLSPGRMAVHVTNGGPQPVTIAQVLVDEADWQFTIEPAATVPPAYQGLALILLGVLCTVLLLAWVSRQAGSAGGARRRLALAFLVALGIGFHNLGEGLAIGAAYSLGKVALGTFLVLGFTIHNTTEGLAIVAPIAQDRTSLRTLVLLGAVAGVPTIVGAWIGGMSYSPVLATLFLAVGAGAIFQVVYELVKMMAAESRTPTFGYQIAGFAAGLLVMYLTGLFVAA